MYMGRAELQTGFLLQEMAIRTDVKLVMATYIVARDTLMNFELARLI